MTLLRASTGLPVLIGLAMTPVISLAQAQTQQPAQQPAQQQAQPLLPSLPRPAAAPPPAVAQPAAPIQAPTATSAPMPPAVTSAPLPAPGAPAVAAPVPAAPAQAAPLQPPQAAPVAAAPVPAPAASDAEPMARDAFDSFRIHCLANLANPKLVKDGAKEMKYAPVEPDVVKRLGTDEAWYVPSDTGSIILGLSGKGNCGVVAQAVDVAGFTRLLEQRLSMSLVSDDARNGLRTRVYTVLHDNRSATLRLRYAAGAGDPRMPVSLSVSDARPVQLPPAIGAPKGKSPPPQMAAAPGAPKAIAGPRPVERPEARPQGPGPRVAPAASPAPGKAPEQPVRAPRRGEKQQLQIAFPGPAAIEAWDPNKRGLENNLTVAFGDACYQTRAQPTDVLARAQQQRWRPLQAAMIGGGFDFAWSTPEQPPEQVLVFYDSLKARCCTSAFGVKKQDLLTAATRRFQLTPDKAYGAAGKEVIIFKARKDYQMSVDFEAVADGMTYANLCYTSR